MKTDVEGEEQASHSLAVQINFPRLPSQHPPIQTPNDRHDSTFTSRPQVVAVHVHTERSPSFPSSGYFIDIDLPPNSPIAIHQLILRKAGEA